MAKELNHYTFHIQLSPDGVFQTGWVENDYVVDGDEGPDRDKQQLSEDDVAAVIDGLKAVHTAKLGPNFKAIDRKQLLLGLADLSKSKADVDAVVAGMPAGVEQIKADVWWNESKEFNRDHPLIAQVGAALSLTPEQIDGAWLTAQESY